MTQGASLNNPAVLQACWTDCCSAINALCDQFSNGGSGNKLYSEPLTLDYKGQQCRVISCNLDGTAVCDVNGREETIQLNPDHIHRFYSYICQPLGVNVMFGKGMAGAAGVTSGRT